MLGILRQTEKKKLFYCPFDKRNLERFTGSPDYEKRKMLKYPFEI